MYSAPYAASASREDLQLVRRLYQFSAVNQNASDVALAKISGHFWYLSEELIALAIFDDGLPHKERQALAHSIMNRTGDEEPGKKLIVSAQDLVNTRLSDLGSTSSASFFKILGIESGFMSHPIESWGQNELFIKGKAIVDNLKVINDHAERAVKLMQDFNRTVTKKEKGYQELLLSVGEHRKSLPNVKKNTLNKKYR